MIRQFDIVENPSARSRGVAPYVMLVQSHLYDEGLTALVAPLLAMPEAATVTRVSLPVNFNGEAYLLMLSELGAVERRVVTRTLGSLADREDDIRRALDRLFTGF
ncbi:MAG: CcdB family protein [Brevundimonas sp.]|nr:CcdB family protein [Brevundimonas sp.]